MPKATQDRDDAISHYTGLPRGRLSTIFNNTTLFLDQHVQEIRYVTIGLAAAGVIMIARSIHMFKQFQHAKEIPAHFFMKNVRLQGIVKHISRDGTLSVEHIPIVTIRWIRFFNKEKRLDLPVKVSGVSLIPGGLPWLHTHLMGSHIWFRLLQEDQHFVHCIVTKRKDDMMGLQYLKRIVDCNFGMVTGSDVTMRLGIIIIVSIATTSCNSIKEEPSDGTTLATNESVSGRKEPKQQNFTYEVTANQRKHVDKIIEGFEALGVISAENKQSCFTLSRIGKYETDENGTKRIQIFMVFDELAHYTILGSTVSPDQVQVNGNSDRTRIGSTEECLQSTAGPVLVDVVTEARGNESAAVVDDSEMDKNVTAFAKHDGDTVAEGGRLTRHQVLVISTCSAILGTFFVVAAILRIRNYIKRVREEREAALLPAFRSCSVALRSANNSDQREEVSRKESTGSKTSKQSNHGNKQTVTIDYGDHKDDLEENPLLTVTSLSAPASPVFIRNEFSELTEKDSDNGEQPSEIVKEPEMVCNDNNDDDDGESDNEGEYECEMAPLVKQPTILEDISEVSEHSSPARHSISMMEETLLQHVNNNALPSVTIPKPPDHVVVNVNNPQNESALYNDPGLPGLGLTSLTQSDLSVSSLNPSYKYGNQTEYISGGGYGNFAYSPVEEVHIPMLQDDIEHKMLESPDLPEPPSFSFSPIVPIPCLNSPDESHNGILNSSSSDETSQISSSSRESSDSSPRASRIEQDPLSDYSFYQQSISDRLNEMNDELFDDMLGPDEDRSIRMAELSEFSSLPTIPESSRENTDAEDYEARVEYPLGRNSWMSNRSYSSDSHDSRGRVTSQPVEQKHPSTNINGSVPKKPTQEPQKDAKIPNMPQFVGNDNSAYDNDHESSDDLDLSDEGQGHSHMHLMDERTLLLSSFEGMESTLV